MMNCRRVQDDLDASDDDPPSVRAARNPNSHVLITVLSEGSRLIEALGANPDRSQLSSIDYQYSANTYVSGAFHCIYNSPLVSATKACLPQNVAILLAAG